MKRVVIGIDPGLNGAVAVLIDRGEGIVEAAVDAIPLNVDGTEIAPEELYGAVNGIAKEASGRGFDVLAVVEKLHPQPAWGSRNFKYGGSYYTCLAAVKIAGIRLYRVTPERWKKAVLRGTDKSKTAAIKWAQEAYPGVGLVPPGKDRPSHDWAEALAMAEFGRLHL